MLDTKLKNNKFIINMVVIISILIASIGMCLVYPKIEKDSEKFGYNIFEEGYRFLKEIHVANYSLYYQCKKYGEEKQIKPSEILAEYSEIYKQEHEDDYYTQNDYSNYKKELDNKIYDLNKELNTEFKNLEYYAIDKESKEIKKKSNGNIDILLDEKASKSDILSLNNNYSFYLVLDYDENANIKVEKIHGANKEVILNNLESLQRDNVLDMNYASNGATIKPISNMKFVYAVPNKLVAGDKIYDFKTWQENYSYTSASYLYINIAMLFIVLLFIIIPYKELKNIFKFDKLSKIPFEIVAFIVLMAIAFIYGSSEIIISPTIKQQLIDFNRIQLNETVKNTLVYLLNMMYWICCFSAIFIGILTTKHIVKIGIRNYLRETCLIYKILRCLKNKTKNLIKWCCDIKLNSEDNKKIIILLLINFVVLSIMCSAWFFGIFGLIIYTLLLYVLVKKYHNKVRQDYLKLLNLTSEISCGNLDIDTNEDLGTFNVLKDEISNIQKGFKNAVDEEVKSQKMKTELISNVSHDLKTPLTSIITYVDLLKDTNLSEEKRELYLDTLEKKSQRLQALIEDLFEVSKATSGNITLNKIDVDVVSLMKQTLLELDDKIKESSLMVRSNYPNGKVILSLDSQRMFRVFENLVINITKYAMQGSRVYIDIIENEEYVEISFKNMTKDEITFNINELAERFVRGDKSRNTEGSGLGLAIAKSFVELQGGIFNLSIDGDLFKVVIKFAK
ncbi:sensor histidine kinase [Romboutsia lituseburensis]|uniref:histidine kinase n=2 Tax=root TaxID=1 RepID=A0A1G9IHS5_9FIRM|nr:sensor histidine kinase [Romboutsia lituseburensis]CEH33894.1 Alkaline phosphatase synthesis sensor protein PhoR [Romboutsia lituseburensis]SDL24585.1 Histidine kinase-, DNA gyrase B-, and HSP90-like ATPase [Romboutsia lituseburensis DSM 797]